MALGTLPSMDALGEVPHIGDGADTVVGDAGGVAGDSGCDSSQVATHAGRLFDDFVAKQRVECWIFC